MQRAGAHFRKLPGVEDGKNAQPEYEAGANALAEKLARLKELRLARDAAARAAPPPVKVKAVRKKKKQKEQKKRPAVALADWLKNRHAADSSS
jgi:chromatin segregation and condensation protein Rec8/ScpA/Scc1 (kleisin family)